SRDARVTCSFRNDVHGRAEPVDAVRGLIAAVRRHDAGLVDIRAARRCRCVATTVGAKATTAVDPGAADVALFEAGVQGGKGAMVAGAELLSRDIEGGTARVSLVAAVGGHLHGGSPELPLQAQVAVVALAVEEHPEVTTRRHGGNGGEVVLVNLVRAE